MKRDNRFASIMIMVQLVSSAQETRQQGLAPTAIRQSFQMTLALLHANPLSQLWEEKWV